MEFDKLIKVRESCRKFADTPVEEEKIKAILEAARLAPSGCNSQPWHFTVISSDPEKSALCNMVIDAMEDGSTKLNHFVKEAPVLIVLCEDHAHLLPMPEQKYGSQHFAQMDVGQAAAYLTLAAADAGLGTCMLGMFQDENVAQLVGAPVGSTVRLIIALGYPADAGKPPREKTRKALKDIVSYGHRKSTEN